jgi:uncharacterized phage protein (TIGR01671 family)
MNKLFRTYYKPDVDTPDGALKFEQEIIKDKLFFVYDDLYYEFQIPFMDDNWLIQQYTGRDDIKGVKIFEGDILKYKNMLYICEYDDREQAYVGRSHKDDFKQRLSEFSNVQIVGNIMENQELLQ